MMNGLLGKLSLLLWLLLFLPLQIQAQSSASLIEQINGKSGKEYVDIAQKLVPSLMKDRKYDQAVEYAQNAYNISRSIGNKEEQAHSLFLWAEALLKKPGNSNQKKANKRQAVAHFKDALEMTNDKELKYKAIVKYRRYMDRSANKEEYKLLGDKIRAFEIELGIRNEKEKVAVNSTNKSTDATPQKPRKRSLRAQRITNEQNRLLAQQAKQDKLEAEQRIAEEIASKDKILDDLEQSYKDIEGLTASQARDSLKIMKYDKTIVEKDNRILRDSYELIKAEAVIMKQEAGLMERQAQLEKEEAKSNLYLLGILASALIIFLFIALLLNVNKSKKRIKKEKQRVDALLGNILPQHIVNKLKSESLDASNALIAEKHSGVSVMFIDFKGFSSFAKEKRNAPKEVVQLLNKYFKAFDQIIGKYGLEKIKTIGDAYMCASGLGKGNGDTSKKSAEDLILAAKEINRFMRNESIVARNKNLPYFDGRIGIHTGDVIAGVVGQRKYAYDIWGDTVNTASRVESNSETNTINISESTKKLLGGKFRYGKPKNITAKNIGSIMIYTVE